MTIKAWLAGAFLAMSAAQLTAQEVQPRQDPAGWARVADAVRVAPLDHTWPGLGGAASSGHTARTKVSRIEVLKAMSRARSVDPVSVRRRRSPSR